MVTPVAGIGVTGNGGGIWEFIEKQDGATDTVTGGIQMLLPTGFDKYWLQIINMTHDTDNTGIYMFYSNDGGSTFITAGSSYQHNTGAFTATYTGETGASDSNEISLWPDGFSSGAGNAAGESQNWEIYISGARDAGINTVHNGVGSVQTFNSLSFGNHVNGMRLASEDNDAVRIAMELGNIDGGIFVLSGLSSSL